MPSPACEAVTVHVPADTSVRTSAVTVHTSGVSLAKDTVRPEVAVARLEQPPDALPHPSCQLEVVRPWVGTRVKEPRGHKPIWVEQVLALVDVERVDERLQQQQRH